ncbi:hypothetical protein HMI54_013006 [Coelomomyces lativittatus]|nr:hypothetical protein HMI54_013006 [Coelomomyces lativittatus]
MLYHAQNLTSTLSNLIQAQSNTTMSSAQQNAFFEFQTQINKTMTTIVKANALGLLSSHVHHRHVQQKLKLNEIILQRMHTDTVRLEMKLQQVEADLTQTQFENEHLKHHLTALRKTCEEAIRHYRQESQRHNEMLRKQESAIQHLLSSSRSSSNVLGYLGMAFVFWLTPKRMWPKSISKNFLFKCLVVTYVLLHTPFSATWVTNRLLKLLLKRIKK